MSDREKLVACIYDGLAAHGLLTSPDAKWVQATRDVKRAFRLSVDAALAGRKEESDHGPGEASALRAALEVAANELLFASEILGEWGSSYRERVKLASLVARKAVRRVQEGSPGGVSETDRLREKLRSVEQDLSDAGDRIGELDDALLLLAVARESTLVTEDGDEEERIDGLFKRGLLAARAVGDTGETEADLTPEGMKFLAEARADLPQQERAALGVQCFTFAGSEAQSGHGPGEASDGAAKIEALALAAAGALRDVNEERRRARSLELYGHTGAHISSIPQVTDEVIVQLTVAAALGVQEERSDV